MSQRTGQAKPAAETAMKEIRRATRKHHSAEEKIRIVLEGLRSEDSIAGLCRREGLGSNVCYRWSKDVLEAGKKRLAGAVVHEATSDEVKRLTRSPGPLSGPAGFERCSNGAAVVAVSLHRHVLPADRGMTGGCLAGVPFRDRCIHAAALNIAACAMDAG